MIKINRLVDRVLTLVWIVVLVYVGYEVFIHAGGVREKIEEIYPLLLLAGLISGVFASLPSVWILGDYFKNLNTPVNPFTSFMLTFLPALGKYVPGKVWAMGSFIFHAKSVAGIKASDSAVYQIYFFVTGLLATLILLVPGYLAGFNTLIRPEGLLSIAVLLLGFPVGYYLLRKRLEEYHISIRFNRMLFHVVAMIFQKLLRGLCLALFMAAFLDMQTLLLYFLFTFIIAIQIGLLAFFAPAGLGVTEAVYVYLLTPVAGAETAILVALLSRVWHMGMDVILAAMALGLRNTGRVSV